MVMTWGAHCVVTETHHQFIEAVLFGCARGKILWLCHLKRSGVVTAGVPFNVVGSTNILRVAYCDEALILADHEKINRVLFL